MEENSPCVDSQRVEHAKRRFDRAWRNRYGDPAAVEHALDELDVEVELWIDPHRASASAAESEADESQRA